MALENNFDGSNSILKNATSWDSKRRLVQQEKFAPTRVTQGNYRTRGEAGSLRLVHFSCSSNNLQQLANSFVPQLTIVVVRYQQLASLQNQSKVSNKVFFFQV
jgi:hypothetical protein